MSDYYSIIRSTGFKEKDSLLSKIRIYSEKTRTPPSFAIKDFLNAEKIKAEFPGFPESEAVHYLTKEFISMVTAEISSFIDQTDIQPFLSEPLRLRQDLEHYMEYLGYGKSEIQKDLRLPEQGVIEKSVLKRMGKLGQYFHEPGSHPFAGRRAQALMKIYNLYLEYFPRLSKRQICGSMTIILSSVGLRENISNEEHPKFFEWIRKTISKKNLQGGPQFELLREEEGKKDDF